MADETAVKEESSNGSQVSQVCILCQRGTIECENKDDIIVHCAACIKKLRKRKKRLFLMKVKELYESCLVCVNLFYNNLGYERHDCTLNGIFVCDGCCRIFVEEENLIVHVNKCNKIIPKINNTESNYVGGSESNSEIKLENCESTVGLNESGNVDKMATSPGNVTAQSKLSDLDKRFSCSTCGKYFRYRCLLSRHSLVHADERPYNCMICNKNFRHAGNLKQHLFIHTNEKPYHCKFCNRNFKTASNLKVHLRLHTGEQPYRCKICNKKFNTTDHLKVHMRKHTGEKPHSCKICNKSFYLAGNVEVHMRLHTGEKPYSCKICNENFIYAGNLKIHMRNHTGEIAYSCKICNRNFNRSDHFKRHMLIHTKEKPYSCKICNKNFNRADHLEKHLRIRKHTGKKS